MKRATNSSPEERPSYSQKDANAILEQAMGADGKTLTDENLEEMAKELGISPAQLDAAKELWFNEQQTQIELEELKTQRWKMTMTALVLVSGMAISAIIVSIVFSLLSSTNTSIEAVFLIVFMTATIIGIVIAASFEGIKKL